MKRDREIKLRLRARGVDALPGQWLEVSKIQSAEDPISFP
jgi:hypothetical protein